MSDILAIGIAAIVTTGWVYLVFFHDFEKKPLGETGEFYFTKVRRALKSIRRNSND